MNQLNILKKSLPPVLAWLSLAIILLVLIPLAYPVKLPLEYHFYHFILFWILFGVYYLNVNFLIPVIHQRYGFVAYVGSTIIIGVMVISFMDAI
ncbi:hypothetical protein [Chryseobacterium sp. MDT2-18]|uniref:hypothetical protein n=1 Tax=Chryseobacterium sp. MDT2-18 TaxID=1259136 RepID=UPI00277FA24C|nr:hypothetical protein [Chryseobacterium sp. MDT2-18]MDQ0477306.1 hypothetical protein [Chryseobacterium sp. MDT2-18]